MRLGKTPERFYMFANGTIRIFDIVFKPKYTHTDFVYDMREYIAFNVDYELRKYCRGKNKK